MFGLLAYLFAREASDSPTSVETLGIDSLSSVTAAQNMSATVSSESCGQQPAIFATRR